MNRRDFLKKTGAALALTLPLTRSLSAQPAPDKPNVIVILTDDQGYGDSSANQHDMAIYTPNLERLARRGITFTDGYASACMCTPSRASLLSGRHHARLGMYDVSGDAGVGFPKGEKIMPQYFKDMGYATACFGKWHVGGDLPGYGYNRPLNKGFDRFWGFYGSTHDYWKSEPGSGFNSTGYQSCGHMPIHDQDEIVKEIGYLTDEITSRSLEFIDQHKDSPFLLYMPHHAYHVPLQVPKDIHEQYEPLRYGPNATITRAMMESLDNSAGAILERLEKYGIEENTLIFFSSDNGGGDVCAMLGWIYRGGKFYLLEAGIRVPTIISWPAQLPQNKIFRKPVTNMDFLPTMIAAAGGEQDPKFEGVNLIPYLKGEKKMTERPLFWMMPPGNGDYAVRLGDWKLVYTRTGRGLYNLKDDPQELNDLSSKMPAKVQQLEKLYTEWNKNNAEPVFTPELRKKFLRMESDNELDNREWQYSPRFGEEE
jgi:arylsulfatase A-like enzyme